MRLPPVPLAVVALASSLHLAACGRDTGGVDAGAAPAPPPESSAAPPRAEAPPAPPPSPPGPPDGRHGRTLFGAALQEIELTDAQRATVNGLLDDLRTPDSTSPTAFSSKLAASIRAGKIDEQAIESALGGREREAHRQAYAAALQKLHEALTPEQRKSLVSKTMARLDEREARLQQARARRNDNEANLVGRGMDRLLRRIELRDGQREKIEKALTDAGISVDPGAEQRDMDSIRERHRALIDAFARDDFDAQSSLAGTGSALEGQPARMIAAMKVVLPLLEEGQRAELADRLERGSAYRGGKDKAPRGR